MFNQITPKKMKKITYEHAQRIRSKMFDYQYGPLVYTSIGCTFRILPKFDIGLQTNYEHKGQAKEQGLRLEGTTYNTLKISPQIYFRPYNGWQFYINADVPVWHKTVGLQMVNSWALQTGIQAQGGLSVAGGCRCLTKELDMIAC